MSNVQENNVQENNVQENNFQENNFQENNFQENNVQENNFQENNVQENNVQENNVQSGGTCDICLTKYRNSIHITNIFGCACVNKTCTKCAVNMSVKMKSMKVDKVIIVGMEDCQVKCPFCRYPMQKDCQAAWIRSLDEYYTILKYNAFIEVGEKEEAEKLQKTLNKIMGVVEVCDIEE